MALSTQAAHRKDLNTGYSSMEHRHFATIAHILRGLPDDARDVAIEHFANQLHHTNPKFNRARFVAACCA